MFLRWSPYNPNHGGAYCDFLEVCNEPNLAPSTGAPPGLPWNPDVTAQLMHNALGWQLALAAIDGRYLAVPVPVLAAPGLDDGPGSDTYTKRVLDRLVARGFPITNNPYWVWTHHNYRDMLGTQRTNGTVSSRGHRSRRSSPPARSTGS